MALNDELSSSLDKILVGDVDINRPNSSAVQSKFGQNINYFADNLFNEIVFEYKGYVPTSSSSVFVTNLAPIYFPTLTVPQAYKLNFYSLSYGRIGDTGTACTVNFNIFDNTGAAAGTSALFSTLPSMTATTANQSNPIIYWDQRGGGTPTTGTVNTSNITTVIPSPTATIIAPGYYLKPVITGVATRTIDLRFVMRFV